MRVAACPGLPLKLAVRGMQLLPALDETSVREVVLSALVSTGPSVREMRDKPKTLFEIRSTTGTKGRSGNK